MATEDKTEKDFSKGAAKALLASVENLDNDAASIEAYCLPLLRVFNPTSPGEYLGASRTAKQQETLLLDLLRSPNKALQKRFFSGLHSIVEVIIAEEAYVPESAYLDDSGDDGVDAEKQGEDRKSAACLSLLKYAALCAEAALEGRVEQKQGSAMQLQVMPQVYEVALQLHTILLSVHDCGAEGLGTRNAILSLCESWWLANAVSRDSLIAQVLPLLVLQASDTTELQKSHIKKLLTFKDAFQVIDFLNPSSESLRSLLLKVASNPLCLKLPEGRKFLTSLFRDPDLVPDLHLSFRAQIPHASKTILQAYGEIYFKAWCEAEDASETDTQEVIEHQVLQDLMHAAIHVASPAMAKSLSTTLTPLHSDKKAKRVADLLSRLYGPILWRSLTAANPLVRRNAVSILEQVFPLHDPNQNQMKASMEKCAAALKNALQDVDPKVRIAASEATANICALFWEALPSSDIRMLLSHVVLEHASDKSSSAVRAQALLTTTALLEIPQSHAVLRPLLPSLGNLIHDKAEKVRLAAVKLLRQIKQTPGIHFYHVVPVDHLSARFSEEEKAHRDPRNSVNKELTALMLSSYFPQGRNISAADQMQRTMTFLMTDPSAASSFYANLADFLEVESVAKFIVMLLACLKSAVQTEESQQVQNSEKGKKRRRYGSNNNNSSEKDEQGLSASNTALMVGLTETMSTLLESIDESLTLPDNGPSKKLLAERLREANLVNILAHFEQKALDTQSSGSSEKREDNFRVCRAILRCASCMPKDTMTGISEFVVDSLEAIANDGSIPSIHVSTHLSLLANWGMIEEIATSLAASVVSAIDAAMGMRLLSPCSTSISRSRKSRGKGRQDKNKLKLPDFSPKFASNAIDDMLSGSSASALALREHLFASSKASQTIEEALIKAMDFTERVLDSQSVITPSFDEVEIDVILSCCEAYGRFAVHRGRSVGNGECGSQIRMVLDWTTEHVLPVLVSSTTGAAGSGLQDLDLSRISNASDSLLLTGSPGLMSPPKQRANLGQKSNRMSSSLSLSGSLSSSYYSLADVVARVLMQSSCLVLSEFLLVGGTYAEEIGSHVSRWCSIFDTHDGDDERSYHMKTQLLPSFLRLTVQLCKSSTNFGLLKELILKYEKASLEGSEDSFKQAAKSLLQANQKAGLIENLTEALLLVCSQLLQSPARTTNQVLEVATASDEVWPGESVGAFLEIVSKNPKSCKLLAEKVLSNLLSHRGGVNNEAIFYAKCLSVLIPVMKSDTFAEKIMTEMNAERPEFEEIRSMMKKVVHAGVSA